MSGYFPFSLSHGLMSSPTLVAPVYQDLMDYQGSGNVQSSRYINPLTNDFELNDNGQFMGQNATDQSVLLALTNTFNSSSVLGLGNNFPSIKLIGTDITTQMTNVLTQTLQSLIDNGNIILGDVVVMQPTQSTVSITFNYFNQSLGNSQTVQFTTQNGVMLNG